MTSEPPEPASPDGDRSPERHGPPPGGSAEPSEAGSPGAGSPEPPRSGLRNPAAAVRGVGAGALILEAVVLLLAIVPLIKTGARNRGAALTLVIAAAVVCVLLCAVLRHRWAWYAAIVPQVALLVGGFLRPALAILGVLFGAVWTYALSVRRSVLGGTPTR